MSQADPITYLWGNMVALAGLGADPSLDRMRVRVGVGRGIVQRIRAAEGVELKSVVTIAEHLGVPVWRLLHPETGSLSGWSSTTLAVASLCNRQDPPEQERVLDVVSALVGRKTGQAPAGAPVQALSLLPAEPPSEPSEEPPGNHRSRGEAPRKKPRGAGHAT